MNPRGTEMRRLMLLLLLLLAMAFLGHGRVSFQLSGNDGISLLSDLTNGSINYTDVNNTTANLSGIPSSAQLSGVDGLELAMNLTNSSFNLDGANNSTAGNLTTWGSVPRDPPPPPSGEMMKDAKFIKIIRDNHIA